MFAREEIVTWQKGSHGNTYGGNPLACAAALATMELIETEYMENAAVMGEYMMGILEELQVRHPSIGQVRGKGLMIGAEFVKDRNTREPDVKLRDRIVDNAFLRGMLLLGCGSSVIRFAPPLSVTKAEIDESIEILEEAMLVSERVESGLDGGERHSADHLAEA